MESIKSLRKWVNEHFDSACWSATNAALNNRIDAIEEEFRCQRGTLWNEGYDMGFASTDDWLGQHEEAMAEHGWARMPEDMDGKYWFCGDKIMLPDGTVVEIIGIGGDWLYYCVASVAITVFGRIRAHDKRHYEQPTVEDVLREFAHVGIHIGAKDGLVAGEFDFYADEDSIAKYAAKLKLRGDGE